MNCLSLYWPKVYFDLMILMKIMNLRNWTPSMSRLNLVWVLFWCFKITSENKPSEPYKIRNRQISEQLLHIRSCVPNYCSEQLSEHQLHSTSLKAWALTVPATQQWSEIFVRPHSPILAFVPTVSLEPLNPLSPLTPCLPLHSWPPSPPESHDHPVSSSFKQTMSTILKPCIFLIIFCLLTLIVWSNEADTSLSVFGIHKMLVT